MSLSLAEAMTVVALMRQADKMKQMPPRFNPEDAKGPPLRDVLGPKEVKPSGSALQNPKKPNLKGLKKRMDSDSESDDDEPKIKYVESFGGRVTISTGSDGPAVVYMRRNAQGTPVQLQINLPAIDEGKPVGKFARVGEVPIDTARLVLVDPCHLEDE